MEEFEYLGVLFTNEGRTEREMDRRIGAAAAVMRPLYQVCRGEERAEPKKQSSRFTGQSMFLPSPMAMGHDRKNKILDTSGRNEFPPQDGGSLP